MYKNHCPKCSTFQKVTVIHIIYVQKSLSVCMKKYWMRTSCLKVWKYLYENQPRRWISILDYWQCLYKMNMLGMWAKIKFSYCSILLTNTSLSKDLCYPWIPILFHALPLSYHCSLALSLSLMLSLSLFCTLSVYLSVSLSQLFIFFCIFI